MVRSQLAILFPTSNTGQGEREQGKALQQTFSEVSLLINFICKLIVEALEYVPAKPMPI